MNDSWGWWIFLLQLSICIRRVAIIINGALFVLFVISCDVWPWDTHQSSSCLLCVTPWSYWSQTITTGEQPISVFLYLSVCIEICWQHILRAIRYADPIYTAHRDIESRMESDSVSWVLTQLLLEYWWILFGWKPANKINLGIINLWIWPADCWQGCENKTLAPAHW